MLLENEILNISSFRERRKSRHKFGGPKVCKAEEVRKYFVNPKTEIEVLSCFICSLDLENISGALFLLHMKTMTGAVSWYILASTTYFILLRVFRFFLFFSFFLSLVMSSITC